MVVVFPHEFVKSYGETYPVLPITEALLATYDVDAHITLGLVPGATEQVRMRKTGVDAYTGPIEFRYVIVDVDTPGHVPATDDFIDEQVSRVPWPCAWYGTRGGLRLLWALPTPVQSASAFEALVANVQAHLRAAGVRVDALPDWTRLYRCPFVVRDGVRLVPRTHALDDIPPLPDLSPAVIPLGEVIAAARTGSMWDEPWRAGEGVRNKRLFATARRFVDAGVPPEIVRVAVHAVNEHQCIPPKPPDEVDGIVDNALRYSTPPPAATVRVGKGEHPRIVRACQEQLATIPGLYQQSGTLVRIARQDGSAYIAELPRAALRLLVEERVTFVEERTTKDGEVYTVPADMPRDVVEALETAADNPVPELQEILSTPTITPRGDLVVERGYHPSMAAYLDPFTDALPPVGRTREDALAAIEKFRDLLSDFPFAGPAHRAAAIAAIITPVVRGAIDGPVPLVIFDGTTPNSGKSLLADIASILVTGRDAPKQPLVDEVEFEKRVTALLMSGVRCVLLDNVDHPVGGATLDALLTADTWVGRVLATMRMVKLRARAQWMVTGNNVRIQGDLSRRAIRCFLAPSMERPEERSDYRYPRPREHVREHRAEYVSAALTIVRAWLTSGEDVHLPSMGSFERWSDVVRSALVWLGEEDPVRTQTELRDDSNVGTWATVVDSLDVIYPEEKSFTSKELFDALFRGARKGLGGNKETWSALEGALDEFLPHPSVRSLAVLLKRWTGRVVGGKKIARGPRHSVRGNLFYVSGGTARARVFVEC